MRGFFPLNGTYFQVNEVINFNNIERDAIIVFLFYSKHSTLVVDNLVILIYMSNNFNYCAISKQVFADDESSQRPIDVPRIWLWNLPRRTLYCGSGITSIFRGIYIL